MRHFYCLLLPLLLVSTALFAQVPAVAPPTSTALPTADTGAVLLFNGWYLPAYQPGTPAADTTGALLSLFRKRRYAGLLFAVPFIVGISLALPLSSTDRYGQRQVASEAISPPLGSAILVGTVVGFIVHATKFGKDDLVAVDRAYAAGHPIPAFYRRRLNDNHFAEATYLRQAIAQQQAREQLLEKRR